MQLSVEQAEGIVREGIAALRSGRAAEARQRFETVARSGPTNAQLWLLLATACGMENDLAGEEAALDRLLATEPRIVRAHIMKGDCRAKAGDDATALKFYTTAMMIADGERLPDDLAAELRRVQTAASRIKDGLNGQREAALAAQGLPPEKRSARFQQSLDIMARRKQVFFQEPTGYFFPELPQIQYYDPARFDWVPSLEAATDDIRGELKALLSEGYEGFTPYIRHDPNQPRADDNQLLDNRDWSALFLCENGKIFEDVVARCPKTWQAIQAAPLAHIANSPTAMFSLLKAGARITPHTGTHNTRLVCHLPLIVPPNCEFRVGNEVRAWTEGKLLIFDDTIEHEAWNNSGDDRVVLIFDIWRPELSDQERREVAALFNGPVI